MLQVHVRYEIGSIQKVKYVFSYNLLSDVLVFLQMFAMAMRFINSAVQPGKTCVYSYP